MISHFIHTFSALHIFHQKVCMNSKICRNEIPFTANFLVNSAIKRMEPLQLLWFSWKTLSIFLCAFEKSQMLLGKKTEDGLNEVLVCSVFAPFISVAIEHEHTIKRFVLCFTMQWNNSSKHFDWIKCKSRFNHSFISYSSIRNYSQNFPMNPNYFIEINHCWRRHRRPIF